MGIAATGLNEAIAKLKGIADRTKDVSPALKSGADDIKKLMADSFRSQASPDGTAWPKDKPATIKRKGSSRTNIDTGHMKLSAMARAQAPQSIVFGSNVPYASYRQDGTSLAPAAPFIPVDAQGRWMKSGPAASTLDKILARVRQYVTTGKLT